MDCFEVEDSLADYLQRGGDKARYFVAKTLAQSLPPPTELEQQEQRLDWAYGNLACSTNHRPLRSAFRRLAEEQFGWTLKQFDKWVQGREWRRE